MRKKERWIILAVFVVLTGFLTGAALPELLHMGSGSYAGLLSRYSLGRYEASAVRSAAVLPYLVSVRLRALLFLWMSCYTPAGLLFHLLYAWWLACSGGLLLSLFMLREGYGGLLLFFCCILPQWLVYASMWKRELRFLARRRGAAANAQDGAQMYGFRQELAELGRLTALCVAGSCAEAFCGLWSLKIFLQLFS